MAHTNEVKLVENQGWDERILVCGNGRLVNTFIVVTQRYVVLVDTVINPQTAEQMAAYARPYLQNGRQLLVINTHADYDHCWGNQLFAGPGARYPAPIIASRECAVQFASPDAAPYLQQMQSEEPDIFNGVLLTPPTILFDERLIIDGGDLTLELLAAPGHTPDHVAIYLPEIKTLLAADAAELPFPFARTVDGLPQMRRSLVEMIALEPEVALYCHAPVDMGPKLLRHNARYFDLVEQACRVALAQGVLPDLDAAADAAALVGLPYEKAVPAGEPWATVHDYYRNTGHATQIRMMLDYLAQ